MTIIPASTEPVIIIAFLLPSSLGLFGMTGGLRFALINL